MRKAKAPSPWSAEVELQVQFYDLDPMQIVWHGNYVKYLEVARCALLDKIGYNYEEMRDSGYMWPIIEMNLRYAASAAFGLRLLLRAEIVEWENRLRIDYTIHDAASGKRLNRATTTQAAVDLKTGEMCFVSPPVLFQKLGVAAP
jgi:acyl-CoA thioester hydrolase